MVPATPPSFPRTRLCARAACLALLGLGLALPATGAPGDVSQAAALMKKRMYRDAARVLQGAVDRQGDAGAAAELRMLAECHYLLQDYGTARPLYLRALRQQTTDVGRRICESRLALTAYRLRDYAGARERIAEFLRKYPTDERLGPLLVVRMKLTRAGGDPPEKQLAAVLEDYRRLAADKERYGYYNTVLASQILGELYIETDREHEATTLFMQAVHEMRGIIAQLKNSGRAVPGDLMQGVDGLSLQIAKYDLERKRYNDAVKWLENVDYVDELVWQARLLLGQIAYQRGEHDVLAERLSDAFLRTVPEGETKSGMYLLLGLASREGRGADLERAKEYLKKIPPGAPGHTQAQHALGDIYREQKDDAHAEPYYLVSVKTAAYAPAALFYLGQIYQRRAAAVPGAGAEAEAQRAALRRQAAAQYETLVSRYPLTAMARQAQGLLAELQGLGVEVKVTATDEDKRQEWERIARESPGSNAAAQALVSLAQYHARELLDPAGTAVIKAPDWQACADACGALLKQGDTPFAGVGEERWREIVAHAWHLAGRAELGSLPAGESSRALGGARPVPLKAPRGADAAAACFRRALALVDARQEPLRRELNLALVEALFKSARPEVRREGEKLYADMEPEYGKDPRYGRLALVLADWAAQQGDHAVAARTYRQVARQAELEREEVVHLLYLAGVNYNRAGRQAAERADKAGATLGFRISPRALLKTAPVTKTLPAFQESRRILWEQAGPGLPAREVLQRVSEAFGVPFVWSPSAHEGGVAAQLAAAVVPRARLVEHREPRTLEQYAELLFDPNRFGLGVDLGASGGTPTLDPARLAGEDGERPTVIEVYDLRRGRFASLDVPYGVFEQVHPGGAMLFHVVRRVEQLTGARVEWAEGVDRENALAQEYRRLPATVEGAAPGCREALERALAPLGLTCSVVPRDVAGELMRESNECFNELRQLGSESAYAEKALFNIAINFYYLKDFGRMRLVLREYVKLFDSPSFSSYYDARYWLGWLFERERRFREAAQHYAAAAAESVVLYRLGETNAVPSLDDVRARLSYDTLYSLSLKATGEFRDARLAGAFVRFIRFNSNVDLELDPAAAAVDVPVNRPRFTNVSCLDLVYEVMQALHLGLRTENGDPQVAERAYYRMAALYAGENLMQQALENVDTLLARFPATPRRLDARRLKVDIYKGLKRYDRVLAALDELRAAAAGTIEPYRLDYETGRVYFDLCDYAAAAQCYARALAGTKDQSDWLAIREALAHAYLRGEDTLAKALDEYRSLVRYESVALRHSVHGLMVHYLEYALAPPHPRPPLPPAEAEFIARYEAMRDEERAALGANELARATWIYYADGLCDLHDGKADEALRKFDAASASPDDFLAGEALVQAGRLHMRRDEHEDARQAFEHLLFAVKAVEPNVRATYWLALTELRLGRADAARRRFEELLEKYPPSPYAQKVREHPFYRGLAAPPEAGAGPGAGAGRPDAAQETGN